MAEAATLKVSRVQPRADAQYSNIKIYLRREINTSTYITTSPTIKTVGDLAHLPNWTMPQYSSSKQLLVNDSSDGYITI